MHNIKFNHSDMKKCYRFVGLFFRDRMKISDGLVAELSATNKPRSALVGKRAVSMMRSRLALVYSTDQIVKRFDGDAYTEMFGGKRISVHAADTEAAYDEVVVTGMPESLILWRTGLSSREIKQVQYIASKHGLSVEIR